MVRSLPRMPPTTTPNSSALNDLRLVLADIEHEEETLDHHAHEQVALLAFSRRASAQPSLVVLLQDAISMLVEVLEADLHGTAEVMNGGVSLSLTLAGVDASGQPIEPSVHTTACDPAISAAAYALASGVPVATPDLALEYRYRDSFLRQAGVVSALSIPLHLAGKPLGALGLYRCRGKCFASDDIRFAETMAHLLMAAAARVKTEQELAERKASSGAVLALVESPLIVLDSQANIVEMNSAASQRAGREVAELRGRPFAASMLASEDASALGAILQSGRALRATCQFDATLLTKSGKRRPMTWTVRGFETNSTRGPAYAVLAVERASPGEDAASASSQPEPAAQAGRRRRADLRRSPRKSFEYRQRIAPVIGGILPTRKSFVEVDCRDISAGGISFYLDHSPNFQGLVVALGQASSERFLAARVVRVVREEVEGRLRYCVGCRFTGRVVL